MNPDDQVRLPGPPPLRPVPKVTLPPAPLFDPTTNFGGDTSEPTSAKTPYPTGPGIARPGQPLAVVPPVPPGNVTPPPPPPGPKRPLQASSTAPNWFYVRRRGEFPGDHPPYETLRQIGLNGILTEADDPLLQKGLLMDRAAGFIAGVWIDPGRGPTTPETVATLQADLGGVDPGTIVVDLEGGIKGPGTPIYVGSGQEAQLLAGYFPGTRVEATSPPTWHDDFNLRAWADAGHDVQVQTYGASPITDLLDPVAVVRHLLDPPASIPPARLSVVIAPLQLPTAPAALRAIGVTRISVFTQDGLTPEVVAATPPLPLPPLPLHRLVVLRLRHRLRRLSRRNRQPRRRSRRL